MNKDFKIYVDTLDSCRFDRIKQLKIAFKLYSGGESDRIFDGLKAIRHIRTMACNDKLDKYNLDELKKSAPGIIKGNYLTTVIIALEKEITWDEFVKKALDFEIKDEATFSKVL